MAGGRAARLQTFSEAGLDLPFTIARSVRKRQAEFFYGRLCAREALRRFGATNASVGVGEGRQPLWPAGLVGSISHSSAIAVAMVARAEHCAGLGVDIEPLASAAFVENIGRTLAVASEDELTLIGRATKCDKLAFTLIFSSKEAVFKACYDDVKRHFDFSAAALVDVDTSAQCLYLALQETLTSRLVIGAILPVHYELIESDGVFTICLRPVALLG